MPVERAEAGDIVAIAGLEDATVADTLCDLTVERADPRHPIDPPTLAMTISVNDCPLCGPRRRQGAEPRHPRAPAARGRRQCRAQGAGNRRRRFRSGGPRRIAAGRADRIHAPRRLRAFDQPPARAVQDREWREAGADRGSHRRRRRSLYRRRHREDLHAQGRDDRTCAPPAPARPASSSTPRRAA